MDAFIQFKVGADGGLAVVIHRLLWDELRRGDVHATVEGEFMRIPLTALTGANLAELASAPGSDQFPCRPSFQLDRVA